jgi:2,4-diaminopentanoate dehydrogenase
MNAINAVLVGVGYMGRLTARYMIENGINIVGVVSRTSSQGEDIATLAGLAAPAGVVVTNDLAAILAKGGVDVVVVTTSSDLETLLPIAELSLSHGANVATISEEAFFPGTAGEIGKTLDGLARANGVTLVATGVQDIFWLNLPVLVSGAVHRIKEVYCQSNVNLDVYGPALISQYPIDLTPEDYAKQAAEGEAKALIPFSGIALEAMVSKLGWTPTGRSVRHEPIYAQQEIVSESLGRTIQPGRTAGVTEIYEIETQEGIGLKMEFIEKVNAPGETEKITWTFKGEPELSFVTDNFPGVEVTCATLVNRIPEIIAAPAGYLSAGVIANPVVKG